MTERARVVIGADGKSSRVAGAVQAPIYQQRPTFAATYYTYWSGVPTDGLEVYIRPDRSWGAFPTHDGLTTVVVSWPRSEFEANRTDVEGNYLKTLELVPGFAERIRAGRREARFVGTGDVPGFLRRPYGPGWALVGDAGYHKDPVTAQGISDAFRDAELCSRALDEAFSELRSFDEAMARYQSVRDETVLPLYDLTCRIASLEPPPPEMARLIGAMPGNQEAMDGWASMLAGTIPVTEFLAPANVERILASAGASVAS